MRDAVVRDSAGVQIVENRAPRWTEETRWTIDSVPALTIGVEEGDPQREFFQVSDVRRLHDGRIVAMNGGTSELRYFSREGAYLCSSGRQGAGPGEFEQMSWLQLLDDDTLLVYSFGGGGRLSILGPDGAFIRTLEVPRLKDVQLARPNGLLKSGTLLMRSGRMYGMGLTSGTHRDSAVLVIASAEGTELARLGPLPSNENAVVASENSVSVTGVIFGRFLVIGFGDGRFYVGTNERYEISEHDTLGRLIRSIRLERQPDPVTTDAIAQAESARMANVRNDALRASTRALLDQMQYPSTMPYYSGMLVDSEGHLWVSRYAYGPGPRVWDVFDPQGQWLGDVRMPDRFMPRAIGDGEVLGIARDELDVQRVQAYRIVKPDGEQLEPSTERRGAGPAIEETPSTYRACGTAK